MFLKVRNEILKTLVKMMKNLFLDSQIWLDLCYFSNDDLTQFKKLKDMLGTDIRLFVTEQVKNEVT